MIAPEALSLLARMSGGVMREFVRYIRDGATTAQLLGAERIDEEVARRVVARHQQEIAPRLNLGHREAIKRVLTQGALSGGEHESTEDDLLRSLHLLSYQGSGTPFWFDAHPNVLGLLR